MAVLANGYNVQFNQVADNGTPKPLYPITRSKDVVFADGDNLDQVIADIDGAIDDLETNYVEKAWLGVNSNTKANITGVATLDANGKLVDGQLQRATGSVVGGVKIADDTTSNASDTATSTKWGKGIEGNISDLEANVEAIADDIEANYVAKAALGVNTNDAVTGVATLDSNGKLNDAQLQRASSTVFGGVKIVDVLGANAQEDSSTTAASEKLARSIQDAATPKAWLGVNTNSETGVTGVATLDDTGKIPSSQLPSYVDDVIEVAAETKNDQGIVTALFFDAGKTQQVTPEDGKIYINTANGMTYRWGGSVYAVVASDLALGETENTAYRGDRGKVAYDHAMNLLPNGEPQTNTNPHGTTKADVGLANTPNMSYAEIESNVETNVMTNAKIVAALGYTPVDTNTMVNTSQNGLFSATDYQAFENMKEFIIANSQPTFASGNGIWVEIVSDDEQA